MKTEPTTITIGGQSVSLFIRKFKYRERMRIASLLRRFIDDPSVEVDPDAPPRFTLASVGEYKVAAIAASFCNEAGAPFYTPDEIDEWDDDDITSAMDVINDFNKLGAGAVEVERGNSAATANDATSSA
jgi:hypothetical protein